MVASVREIQQKGWPGQKNTLASVLHTSPILYLFCEGCHVRSNTWLGAREHLAYSQREIQDLGPVNCKEQNFEKKSCSMNSEVGPFSRVFQ